jgi:hypothetical protein
MYHQLKHSQILRSAHTVHLCVFCVDLRTNSDYFSIQHWLTGFYNRGSECLQRGTDWVFKSDGYNFVNKGLNQQGTKTFRFAQLALSFLVDRRINNTQKGTVSFVMSVLSVRSSAWNHSAPTGRIFMKFYIWGYLENLWENPSFVKYDHNYGYYVDIYIHLWW